MIRDLQMHTARGSRIACHTLSCQSLNGQTFGGYQLSVQQSCSMVDKQATSLREPEGNLAVSTWRSVADYGALPLPVALRWYLSPCLTFGSGGQSI